MSLEKSFGNENLIGDKKDLEQRAAEMIAENRRKTFEGDPDWKKKVEEKKRRLYGDSRTMEK